VTSSLSPYHSAMNRDPWPSSEHIIRWTMTEDSGLCQKNLVSSQSEEEARLGEEVMAELE
jgi:hypothetical protein